MTYRGESLTQGSGGGFLIAVTLAGGALGGVAPVLRPWRAPEDTEDLLAAGAWWTAAALAGWLVLSVIAVLMASDHSAAVGRWESLLVPGSYRLAQALLVVLSVACSPSGDVEPPRMEILGTVGPASAPDPASEADERRSAPAAETPPRPVDPGARTPLGVEPDRSEPRRFGGHDGADRSPLLDFLDQQDLAASEDSPPSEGGPLDDGPVSDPAERTHVVEPGEHLWMIARLRLTEFLGRSPSEAEITDFWVEVIRANRGRIRSGNPDLIHPGEIIVLPELRAEPGR